MIDTYDKAINYFCKNVRTDERNGSDAFVFDDDDIDIIQEILDQSDDDDDDVEILSNENPFPQPMKSSQKKAE